MKKIGIICLVLILSLAFAACGGDDSVLSANTVEVKFAGLQLDVSEDFEYVALDNRLAIFFAEDYETNPGAVLISPDNSFTFSQTMFENVVNAFNREAVGDFDEITVNGGTAFLQHFEENFVLVMFEGYGAVYAINFSGGEDNFDTYLPYFMELVGSIREVEGAYSAHPVRGPWSGGGLTLTFYSDGTGLDSGGANNVNFVWTVEDGTLTMEMETGSELTWYYTVSGDSLTLEHTGGLGTVNMTRD
jgi:hypothetical protein